MTFEILLLLALLAATLTSFVLDLLPVEVTAFALLAALLVTGLVTVDEAIGGLSNKAVVTVGAMFVLSQALVRTGLLEVAAAKLSYRMGGRSALGIAILLALTSVLSGFLNNTAVVAILIPLAVDLSRRFAVNPSRLLMPLAFAATFGGTLTLIGTSTNLLIGAVSEQAGVAPLGMFEFTPLGAVFVAIGLVYVVLAAPGLLPERDAASSLTGKYRMTAYLTEVRVERGSRLIGSTVLEADLSQRYDVTVLAILRGQVRHVEDLRALELRAGDIMVVRGSVESMVRMRTELGLALLTDVKLPERELTAGNQAVVEAIVSPASSLIGETLRDTDFRRRYGAFVLAIRREGETLHARLARTPLRFSDTLLLVTPRDRLDDLRASQDLIITSEVDVHLRRRRFWWLVLPLLPAAMIGAAVGAIEIAAGALVACVLLLVTGALEPREAYRSVDWSVVLFIAAFIPVGNAMLNTGAASSLAGILLAPIEWLPAGWQPWVAVSLLYLVTSLMTETITNNATAIIVAPVALGMANELGIDPRPLVFAVCFAASASFMTPTGYQTNMMVYGPGGYRFLDYTRFGTPLNLAFWIVASLLIPRFWPF